MKPQFVPMASSEPWEQRRRRWTDLLGSGLMRLLLLRGGRECITTTPGPLLLRLERNQPLRLGPEAGWSGVKVRRGTLWLTGTPANGDVLLRPGDGFRFGGGGLWVLEALSDAEIVLTP